MTDANMQMRAGAEPPALEGHNDAERDAMLEVHNNAIQRPFPPEPFPGGGFPGPNNAADEFGFVAGGGAHPGVHYPDGRTSMVLNVQHPNMSEQDALHVPGANDMFAMANQRAFASSIQREPSYPLFSQPMFGNIPSNVQNARFSFNQFPQNLNPAVPDGANRPAAFPRQQPQPQPQPQQQQPQPQPQPVTPSPQQQPHLFPFWGHHFQNFGQVNAYLSEVAWFPSMGRYGLPQSSEQYKFYLEKLCVAIRNTHNVWDMDAEPWQFGKFLPKGEWTDPRDIEAIAHNIMFAAMKMHVSGVTDFAHMRSVDYMSHSPEDVDFTFPQRIHFMACLLTHSKKAAADVMARVHIEKYLATPITSLRTIEFFDQSWAKASDMERKNWTEINPYIGAGVVHPSVELQAQLTAMSASRFRQTFNSRQRRDSSAAGSMVGGMRGPAPAEQASPSTTQNANMGPGRPQPNVRIVVPGGNDRFHPRHHGQASGEGPSPSDMPGM